MLGEWCCGKQSEAVRLTLCATRRMILEAELGDAVLFWGKWIYCMRCI